MDLTIAHVDVTTVGFTSKTNLDDIRNGKDAMMVTKKKDAAAELIPAGTPAAISMTPELTDLEGYSALEVRDQDRIRNFKNEAWSLADKRWRENRAMGEKLMQMRNIMKAKRMWEHFIEYHLPFSRATANRILLEVERLEKLKLPEPIMVELRKREKIDVKRLEKMPAPPKNLQPESARQWVEQAHDPRHFPVSVSGQIVRQAAEEKGKSTDELVGEIVQKIRLNFERVEGSKAKQKFITEICSIALGVLGVGNPQTIAPQAFPTKWMPNPVGRPRLDGKAAGGR